MVQEKLAIYRGSSAITAGILATMLAVASAAHAQTWRPCDQTPFTGMPRTLHSVADTGDRRGPDGFADLAERIVPAVIGVVSKAAGARGTRPDQSFELGEPSDDVLPKGTVPTPDQGKGPKNIELMTLGSGFFISPDGYAVTNGHVVEDTDTAEIRTNDNKTYSARVVGRDALSDLALIKVEGRTDFTFVKFADRSPRVGDWVLTAGNTFGLGGTVTAGIVSARERELEESSTESFVQIDAPLNQGDSGGPTFNTDGEVIGVNSMIYSLSGAWSGVAFAVPADTVKRIVPQLKDKGLVTRGSIGADVQSVTPDIADSLELGDVRGAIVARVEANGPAEKAGLKAGDVITSVDGEPIKNAHDLTRKIHSMAPGSTVRLAKLRNKTEGSLSVTLTMLADRTK